jgi:hypothetical protein
VTHYSNDSSNPAFVKESADMEHDEGICIEYRDGLWIVGGCVIVDSIQNALELAA